MAVEADRRVLTRDGAGVSAALLAVAAVAWWWSARMADEMNGTAHSMHGMGDMQMGTLRATTSMSFAAFTLAWLAMMAAMMLPAVSPVVRLYSRAAGRGTAAPLPVFVSGYLVVWTAVGVPAYFAWRFLMDPIAEGEFWAARLGGVVLLLAAVWQLTPLKAVCLRHCRSPMSVFLRVRGSLARPAAAVRLGGTHGLYCVGCCWALMAVLVAMGTMNLGWMIGLAVLILLEKNAPWGERVASIAAVAFLVIGVALIAHPPLLTALT